MSKLGGRGGGEEEEASESGRCSISPVPDKQISIDLKETNPL